ncbi:sulfur carrier protein ThiS [Halioxenophilus sp. WMMB6]|uniref:sulfur carrier protein ThiS n=1 Tax=Halioxenophilus sp. WMMB6 TaxID=3073815 RepID=UPI00295F11EB|nr:sulfur carrier protein ThiS [Halioxenophilus sp. WMMB6]
MITIFINGERQTLAQPENLQQLLAGLAGLPEKFALAVNGAFIPAPDYSTTAVASGDEIELLVPMQGG